MKTGTIVYKAFYGSVFMYQKETNEFLHPEKCTGTHEHNEEDFKKAKLLAATIQQIGKLYFLED